MTLKLEVYFKKFDCTGGMSPMIGKPAKEDGVLVKVLKHVGAVPFVRTNIPQTMMT
jgi:fatty acid amide hydrolase